MSRAFVKESETGIDALPELAISPHPNRVTASGLAQLQARVDALEAERMQTRSTMSAGAADAAALARIERDLRYFRARLASARVVAPHTGRAGVGFGCTVALGYPDGQERRFRIVGEDEADPAAGLLSWVSPLARALEGAEVAETVPFGGRVLEVLSIEA